VVLESVGQVTWVRLQLIWTVIVGGSGGVSIVGALVSRCEGGVHRGV
jgi:hypothetical protein